MPEQKSNVNPLHYAGHEIAPIDLIEAYGFGTGFNCGNAIKYIARHKEKGGREDLVKGAWYLLRELGVPDGFTTMLTEALVSEERTKNLFVYDDERPIFAETKDVSFEMGSCPNDESVLVLPVKSNVFVESFYDSDSARWVVLDGSNPAITYLTCEPERWMELPRREKAVSPKQEAAATAPNSRIMTTAPSEPLEGE